jgi:hypothetical protein
MTRFPRISAVLLIPGILAAPAVVRGDTVTLTGAAMSRPNELGIVDVAISSPDHRFSLTASGSYIGGQYDLYNLCVFAECKPGRVLSLGALWSGSDFSGTATADGLTFPLASGGDEHTGDALAHFQGTWTVPPFTGTTTTSVIAPFTFTGFVDYPLGPRPGDPDAPPGPFPRRRDDLVGSGLTTIKLVWGRDVDLGAWTYAGARYDFAPTPEPGTLLLVAPLALGLVRRHSITRRARS